LPRHRSTTAAPLRSGSGPWGVLLAADAVHRPARRLPRVVRSTRAEPHLVRDYPRVEADLLRTLRVAEEVRVVLLLPDEHEVGRRHELRHEEAAGRRTGE